jgi:MFS transporter, DHA2 family, multidrug resistance protein
VRTITGDNPPISHSSVSEDGLPLPSRHLAMVTIAISLTLALLDGSIANVALPMIALDLHAGPSTAIWVVNGYQLALAVCLLPFAAFGERYGYRTVYKNGLVLFTVASLACAFSSSMLALTLARIAQGVGAAGILAVNTALIRYVVPHHKLGSALGLNSLVAATSATLGPTVAGAILSVSTWPWLFAINLPLGLLAIVLARRNLPDSDRSARPVDILSALLSAAMIGTFIMAVECLGHALPLSAVIAQLAAAIIFAVLLVRHERGRTLPAFPFDLLQTPVFKWSLATSLGVYAAQMMCFVSLPFLLHTKFGYSAGMVGLLMTPWPFVVALVSPLAGRLSDRVSPGLLGGLGLAIMSIGLLSFSLLSATPQPFDLVWRMMLCGFGFGLFQSPNNRAMVGSAPRHRSGAASGMLGSARLIGQATGTAMVALLLAEFQMTGAKFSILIAAVLAGLSCVVSLRRVRYFNMESPPDGVR